jgi:hypothetical protein
MNSSSERSVLDSETLTPAQVLGYGTLSVGTIEILDSFIFLGLRGVPAIRIPQSTA